MEAATMPQTEPDPAPGSARQRTTAADRAGDVMRRFGLLVVFALLILVFSILEPSTFATFGNAKTILGSQTVLVVLALGLIVPFTAGEFDISVAGTLSICTVLVGWLNVIHGWPIVATILAVLLVGVLIGLANAFFVVYIGIDSIVVTLAMGTLLTGVGFGINNVTTPGISPGLVSAIRDEWLGLPAAFFYAVALTLIVWYVFSYTPAGRYLYFVGAGRDVARLSGIRVTALRVYSFMISGGLSALAGIILAGWLGASDPNASASYLLPAFAAIFLGSTAITPGRFNPWGSFIAAYFLVTGIAGLQLVGFTGWVEQVFSGASLIVAVTLSRIGSARYRSAS